MRTPLFARTARCAVLALILLPALLAVSTLSYGSGWVLVGHSLPQDEDLVPIDGILELPDGEDPLDFLIVNAFDVAYPDAAGGFSISVRGQGMTVNAAVRRNEPGQPNPWVGVTTLQVGVEGKTVRLSSKTDPELRINARSTAMALVQASPFVLTRDPLRAMILKEALEELPEFDALEMVISDVYSETPDFADHPAIRSAHEALIIALDRAIPSLPPPLHFGESFTTATVAKASTGDKAQPLPTRMHSLDPMRQVEYRLVQHGSLVGTDLMMMEAVEFMPLDSVATMRRLDPSSLYRYTDESGRSNRLRSIRDAMRLRNLPHQHPIFDDERDFEDAQVALLEAKSMYRWINLQTIATMVLNAGLEALLPDTTADGLLAVDRDRTGVYIIRVHTGKLHDGIRDSAGESLVVMEHHLDLAMFALSVNFSMALLDVIDMLVGFRVDSCNPLQAFLPAIGTELLRQSWGLAETNPNFISDTLFNIFTTFIPVMIDHYAGCLLENPGTALLAFAKSVLTLEQVTRRLSAVGSISDRIAALTGAPLYSMAAPLVSPMDTVIVVVGDPFSPLMTSVEYTDWEGNTVHEAPSHFASLEGAPPGIFPGETITIRGRRLISDGEIPRRFLVEDIYGMKVEPEVVSSAVVGDPNDDFPLEEIVLQLPLELLGTISVTVTSQRGSTMIKTAPVAEIVPRLLSASPDMLFGHTGSGSTLPNNVNLEMIGFDRARHQVFFGTEHHAIFMDGMRRGYFVVRLDWQPPGLYEVRVRWRTGEPMVGGEEPLMVRVLDEPTINAISPDPVVARGTVNISGLNFGREMERYHGHTTVRFFMVGGAPGGTSVPIRRIEMTGMDNGNQQSFLIAEVPNIAGEEADFEVEVRNPRGTSNRFPVTVLREADPPYQRQVRNYRFDDNVRDIQETTAQVLSWASHNPPPPGQRQYVVECVATTCPDQPALRTDVRLETLPDTSPSHSSRELVSPPPGYAGQAAIPAENCGPCDSGATERAPHAGWPTVPDRWEDIGTNQVRDTVRLAGDISGVYTGSHARIIVTPSQSADVNGPGPARFVHDGIILQGASHVDVEITPGELAGTQILAVRNSSNVTIEINVPQGIPGTSPLGIVIENSSNVSLFGTIRNANLGVLVRNSTLVNIENLHVYPAGPNGRGMDVDGGSMIVIGSVDFYGEPGATQDNRMGLRLRGGLENSRVISNRFYGLSVGLEVEDIANCEIGPLTIGADGGSHPFVGNILGGFIEGDVRNTTFQSLTVTGNDVGLEIRGGVGNVYTNLNFGNFNLGQQGTGNRIGLRVEDTGQPFSDNLFWSPAFHRNRQRHAELIGLDDVGVFRGMTLGGTQAQAGVNPSLFDNALSIIGCLDLEIQGLLVRGGVDGVRIEDSQGVRFHDFEIIRTTGTALRADRSSRMEFFDGTINGSINDGEAGRLDRGIHLLGCSDFQFSAIQINNTFVTGIEIEQPAQDAVGLSRLLGRKNLPGQTSPPTAPPRETSFSPFRRPPSIVGTYTSSNLVRVLARNGPAVHIHSGAHDITLGGSTINSMHGPALRLQEVGPNVSVTLSSFTPQSQATGQFPAILVEDCIEGDLYIGRPEEGNSIFNSRGWGIEVHRSRDIRIQGNYIGTDSGTFPRPNALGGILVVDSGDIEIGGPEPIEGNLISGNNGPGVLIRGLGEGSPPLLQANFIGTTEEGTLSLPNDGHGIIVESAGPGLGPAGALIQENLISGNVAGGVFVDSVAGADGAVLLHRNIIGRAFPFDVFGVFIGVDTSDGNGVRVIDSAGIVLRGNRIAWYDQNGVLLDASDRCHLQNNAIFAHGGDGVRIERGASRHTMLNNEFANNEGAGVHIAALSRLNTISMGELRDNAAGSIVLEPFANDDIPAPIVCEVYTRLLPDGMRLVFARGQVAPWLPDGTRVEIFSSNNNENALQFLAATPSWEGEFHVLVAEIEPGAPIPSVVATVSDAKGNTSAIGPTDPQDPRCLDEPWIIDRPDPPLLDDEEMPWVNLPIAMETDGILVMTTLANRNPVEIETGLEDTHTLHSPTLVRDPDAPRLLAFTAIDSEGLINVYLMDLDEAEAAAPAAPSLTESWSPRLSPNGDYLALVSNEDGTPSVYLLDVGEGILTRLTDDEGSEDWPDWSPDGESLVYLSDRDGDNALYIHERNGHAGTDTMLELPEIDGPVGRPAWGVFEKRIAFEWTDGTTHRVGWIDPESGRTWTVPLLEDDGHLSPAWLPGLFRSHYLLLTVLRDGEPDAVFVTDPFGYPRWRHSPRDVEEDFRDAAVGAPVVK